MSTTIPPARRTRPHPSDASDTLTAASLIWAVAAALVAVATAAPGFNVLDVLAASGALWAAGGTTQYLITRRMGCLTQDQLAALLAAWVLTGSMLAALLAAGGVS